MAASGILGLAWRHNQWLSARQAVVASNIANINTPGYRARDIEPFDAALARVDAHLASTHARHMRQGGDSPAARETDTATGPGLVHSGNTVDLERQLSISGEAQQAYALNAGIVRTFHRMVLSGLKG